MNFRLVIISRPQQTLLLSGVFFLASQLHLVFWWCVFPSFILFILACRELSGWRSAVWAGVWVGTLKSLGGFAWVWHAYPLVWVGIESLLLQFFLVASYWVTTSVCMGSAIALASVVAYRLRNQPYLFLLVFPLAWLVSEVLGSFLVSIWLLGPGSYLNVYIGHGYAGLPLAHVSILFPVIAIAGLYGLTYVAALLGSLLTLALLNVRFMTACLICLLFTLILSYAFYPKREVTTNDMRIVAVDTSFTASSQKTEWGRVYKGGEIKKAINVALSGDEYPDIILLPEDSRLTTLFDSPSQLIAYFHQTAPGAKSIIVDSTRVDIGDGHVTLRAFYYDLGAESVYMTDKQFLVPQGEYVTYPFLLLLKLLGQQEVLVRTSLNQNYVPGPLVGYANFPSQLPPLIFCFESSSIWGIKNVVAKQNSGLVLHPVSHSWFNNPHILQYQLAAMLKIQSAWNNSVIITAGNMAESTMYRPNGHIEKGEVISSSTAWRLVEYKY